MFKLDMLGDIAALRAKLKRVADKISTVKSEFLLNNVAPVRSASTSTSNGITYISDGDGNVTASGTASGASYFTIYNNATAFPENMSAGKTYYCPYMSDDIAVKYEVFSYDSEGNRTLIASACSPFFFALPADSVGMRLWIYVGNGHSVDRVFTPEFYDKDSLAYARRVKDKTCAPMLSIIYDDGFEEFNTLILPIIQEKCVPIATAVIPENIGRDSYNYLMSWETIQSCYAAGAEILPHFGAKTEDDWNTLGTQGVSSLYYTAFNAIRAHSIHTPNVVVFSGSSSQYKVCRQAARRVAIGGFNASAGGINYHNEFDPYYINRYGTDNKTLDVLKGWIDDLVTAGTGWMVWTRHNGSSVSPSLAEAAQILSDAIDYALEQGVQIVTVERGLQEYLE